MTGRKFSQILLIELLALFQGLAFGIIPALVGLLTSPDFHDLSMERVRILFLPFVLAAILLAAMAGWISQRGKLHQFFIGGMVANFIALGLIALTTLTFPHPELTFSILFVAHFFLGGGVSTVITVLSRWIPALFPKKTFRANLLLWAGFSFGMLLSGGLIEYVLLLHKWWLAPLLVLGALFILLLIIDLFDEYPDVPQEKKGGINKSIFIFLIPVVLYGYLSSTLGVWDYDLTILKYELLFFGFWAITTVSRVLIGISFPIFPPYLWYCLLPILIIIAPLILPYSRFFLAFALAALFPINLVWMQRRFLGKESLVTGLGIACYLFGIALGRPVQVETLIIVIGGSVLFLFHLFTTIAFPAQQK